MKYARFFKTDIAGNISEQLGSDGVMVLDGRWGATRIHDEAKQQAQRLNLCLNKNIVAYEIWSGRSFSDSHRIVGYTKLTA